MGAAFSCEAPSDAALRFAPLDAALGAEVHGIDLAEPIDEETLAWLKEGLARYRVLFFRDQRLDDDSQVAVAARFGTPMPQPLLHFRGAPSPVVSFEYGLHSPGQNSSWHTDVSWVERPPSLAVLRAVVVPEQGGDTLWTDVVAAYAALPAATKRRIAGLRAIHDFARGVGSLLREIDGDDGLAAARRALPAVAHPVVCTHPATGEKLLFVNPGFTQRIEGLPPDESDALLAELFAALARPEIHCRFRWTPGAVAIWDERATQHRVEADYHPRARRMHRVTVAGDRPEPG